MKQFGKGRDGMVVIIEAASEMVGDCGIGDAPAHERGSRPDSGKRMTRGTVSPISTVPTSPAARRAKSG